MGGPTRPLAHATGAAHAQLTAAEPTSNGGPHSTGIDAAAAERRAVRNKAARNRKQRRVRSTLIERQLRIQDLEQQLERALNTARGQPPAAAAPTTQPPAALPAQRGGFESPLPPPSLCLSV